MGENDPFGTTALMLAARSNSSDVLQALLSAGACVNQSNRAGMTALMLAAAFARAPRMITLLLAAGANPSLKADSGETALSLASRNPFLTGSDAIKALAH